jgi:hypothetical protein
MPRLGFEIGGQGRRRPATQSSSATPRTYAFELALGGLVLIFVSSLLDEHFHTHSPYVWAFFKLLDESGIALILLGLVVVVLEFRDWREYFQHQIANTIVQKEYLKTLGNEELISLQTDTLKAFFKIDDIDRTDGFLQFFHARIHGYIGSPYREDARDLVTIRYADGGTDLIDIEEALSYTCRKVGDSIQADVKWEDTAETPIKLVDYSVAIQVPVSLSAQFKVQNEIFKNTTAASERFIPRGDQGFQLLLNDYKCADGLLVKVHVHYTMPTSWPIVWTMSHPTKGATVTISYPNELQLLANFFGMKEDQVSQEKQPGVYQVGYDSWLLPDTGFAFQLIKRDAGVAKAAKSAAQGVSNATLTAGPGNKVPVPVITEPGNKVPAAQDAQKSPVERDSVKVAGKPQDEAAKTNA